MPCKELACQAALFDKVTEEKSIASESFLDNQGAHRKSCFCVEIILAGSCSIICVVVLAWSFVHTWSCKGHKFAM